MTDFAVAPATELAAGIRSKRVLEPRAARPYLDRIERLNGPVNAVVTLDVERARAEADAADEATARGDERRPAARPADHDQGRHRDGRHPLDRRRGRAHATTCPTADAPAVARLKAAGRDRVRQDQPAALVGRPAELQRDLRHHQQPVGPRPRVPGGSSGGPAAAVAVGLTSFELGTDIGGSVRIPSHCCGMFGLKPSYGVVPQRGYLDHVGGGTTDADINVFGPMARSADDLDLLLGVLAGPAPEQAPAWRIELPAPTHDGAGGRRIGAVARRSGVPHRRRATSRCSSTPAPHSRPPAPRSRRRTHPSTSPSRWVCSGRSSPRRPARACRPRSPRPSAASHLAWLAQQKARAALQRVWADWFEGWDALLCPVMPTAAFPHDQEGDLMNRTTTINDEIRPYVDNIAWCGLIGIMGLPSAVPPVGFTPDGLPVGVQVVTPYLQDLAAVELAGLIAEAAGTGYRTPPGF